ncbi:DMT family transporter [Rhodobacteraceae bacterium RKSG542]|uniref:DMT family transporter n=1 Tax=Pseudovibrio flavus TaxID=2529854 RepID=UPI0012BC17B8|nr:DMT family transporter [Pseudovibrio flavus]MTI16227.1 DMT family transporter [Pseudovibrio flavus]
MSTAANSRNLGIAFAILATLVFAVQDAVTKTLVINHSVWFILMARYWVHLIIAVCWACASDAGLKATIKTKNLPLQLLRGFFLFAEIALIAMAFRYLGLADVTTIFMANPLIVTALAVPVLGEVVGWRRIAAMLAGLIGLVIILQPSGDIWGPGAILAVGTALSYAIYQLITRMVASRNDSALTSFFYVGAFGAVVSTILGIQNIPPVDEIQWGLLAMVCGCSALAHFSIVKALSLTQANEIQPFMYLQLVWAVPIGFLVFADIPTWSTILGAVIIIGAGLFSLRRQKVQLVDNRVPAE